MVDVKSSVLFGYSDMMMAIFKKIRFDKERERIFLVTALILKKSEVDALRLDVDGLFKDVIGNCANVLTVAAHLVA